MRKDFVNEVAKLQRISRADLVEKDLILQEMLVDLSRNNFFSGNFAFKGGTCLTKCYLGYFRFSEDIDFTWKNQKVFEGKSQKAIRGYLSEIIDNIGDIFGDISAKRGLDFRCQKNNRTYVELGGGNKTCTFKIWYQSEILDRRSFVKVQINFVEKILFPIPSAQLRSLVGKAPEELKALFPEHSEYWQELAFNVYDIKEILCEKIRSILTREGLKARDFLDVYLICKAYGIKLKDTRAPAIAKTRFALDLYEKYRKNLADKKNAIVSAQTFRWGEEKSLLLQDIHEEGFYRFLKDLNAFLKDVVEELA